MHVSAFSLHILKELVRSAFHIQQLLLGSIIICIRQATVCRLGCTRNYLLELEISEKWIIAPVIISVHSWFKLGLQQSFFQERVVVCQRFQSHTVGSTGVRIHSPGNQSTLLVRVELSKLPFP
jgi:hypothetical protein